MTNELESPGFIQIKGIQGAVIELALFFVIATAVRNIFNVQLGIITYYWLAFTVLTGIWEISYVFNKNKICKIAHDLIINDEHVWGKTYNVRMILPSNTAIIFYAEYAAHSDRLYANSINPWIYWSLMIESSHGIFCGLSALLMFIASYFNFNNMIVHQFLIQSMAFQMMNSMLYMGQYYIQTQDPRSENYVTDNFPVNERKFMLINLFWTVMPALILFTSLFTYH
jgi:hypothetical protein